MTAENNGKPEKFSFSSSVAADVWHPKTDPHAYEWWYFDALSDDGNDAVVVIFLDNFIFSPRYNRAARVSKSKTLNSKSHEAESRIERFPALAFVYYHKGKPIYRAINEFSADAFTAGEAEPSCRLGENNFTFESAPYGSGYLLSIRAVLRKNFRLEAQLEWLSIESDFLPDEDFGARTDAHCWNLVAARSDVTGSIKVSDDKGKPVDVRHFRGTGYHDHNLDARWLPASVKDWQWGRAHFSDATAVYYRYRELDSGATPVSKLFLIKDGALKSVDAECEESQAKRNVFGLKYPKQLTFSTEEGVRLEISQSKTIDASFFYLRFLSEARLTCSRHNAHEAFAITEHLAPRALKYRWLDWLVNMRIGIGGKGSFLP